MFAVASAELAMLIGVAVAGTIERLTRAAERVAAGERQAPLPEPRGREVRALTHALESMRRELEERDALEISGGVQCVAQVRDHGPGVDPAIRDRLFERFATTRHGDGGTGLGLAIVRAVAELHGGRAELRETGPRGSVFSLSLPRA